MCVVVVCVFRQGALELERMVVERREEEEAWHRQQQLQVETEEQRRKMMEVEEKRLTDQRIRSVHRSCTSLLVGYKVHMRSGCGGHL